ncbi:cyclin-dependent protein kinase inhibitor SMR9-like [Nicotiana sylvestris]|uniref:cyclin-dependent protein kinase inhibitor SMR9-like n=1 Tax=Nicotiana sylvestris TaxID=4096 RepID=UPI00388C67D1
MGPSSKRRRTRSSTTRNSRTSTLQKKQQEKKKKKQPLKKNEEEKSAIISPCKSPCKEDLLKRNNNEMELENICSTPKAERFKIPEIKTCPPAPKKRRIVSSSTSSSCHSLRRNPVTFFAPPDLDHFFFLALGNIQV